MKKSTKILALGLALVPCALVMTACGGDEGLVSTKADYKAAQTTSYSTVVSDLEEKGVSLENALTGMRAVMTVDIETEFMGYDVDMTMKSDSYLQAPVDSADRLIDLADLSASQTNTLSIKIDKEKESISTNTYILNGNAYYDASEAYAMLAAIPGMNIPSASKYYMPLETSETEPISLDAFKLTDYIAQIPEGEYGSSLKISTYEKGDTYKVKITIDSSVFGLPTYTEGIQEQISVKEMEDLELYFVFENGSLVGIEADLEAELMLCYSMETTYTYMPLDIDATLEIVPYTGTIAFPSADELSSYVDYETAFGLGE